MYTLDRGKARDILITELGYDPKIADVYLDSYPEIHEDLADAAKAWLEDRTVVDVMVEGVTIRQLMDAHDSHFLNALSSLNDLLTLVLDDEQKSSLVSFLRSPLIRALRAGGGG